MKKSPSLRSLLGKYAFTKTDFRRLLAIADGLVSLHRVPSKDLFTMVERAKSLLYRPRKRKT